MTKNQVHEWHENREEDGKKRYYRAYWNSRAWVFRKYQRRRVPFRLLQNVDAILEGLGVKIEE